MFPNHNPVAAAGTNGAASMEPQQQSLNYNGLPQQQPQQQQQQQQQQQSQSSQAARNARKKPHVRITEQPAGKALRFRYECEGRSAGSIPGVNSTSENKTYPTIEIVGYKGRAVVVVSCVTKDPPYRPHPHNLVGKEGCKKGVCTLEINSETMRAVFSNLGIQCVKKKDIESALKAREEIRVDPFKTGFSHRFQPSSIDLNSVRLCFQVFMESEQRGRFTSPLPPVVSEPIFDKKAMSDLVICRLCSCSASVLGNTQIILLCEKVAKEDIAVRFFEEKNGHVWEAFGDFQHTDVHKQTAITFKTPRYHTIDITEPAKVFIQLRRPSDGVTSEALPFEYVPLDSGRHTFWNLHRHLKRKPDEDIFQQILSLDAAAAKREAPTIEVIDLNTPCLEQPALSIEQVFAAAVEPAAEDVTDQAAAAAAQEEQQQQQQEQEAERLRSEQEKEIDTIIDAKVRELEQLEQQRQQLEKEQLQQRLKQQQQLEQELLQQRLKQQQQLEQEQLQQRLQQQQQLEQEKLQQQQLLEQAQLQQQLDQQAQQQLVLEQQAQQQQQQQLALEQLAQQQQQLALEQEQLQQQLELEQQQHLLSLEPRQLTANDKINKWMKSNEFRQTHEGSPIGGSDPVLSSAHMEATAQPQDADEDKTLNELLEQVAEMDEIYTDYVLRRDNYNNAIDNELQTMEKAQSSRPPMEVEESFDDAATYTSLQIAFKNPVTMQDLMPPTPPMSQCAPEDAQHYDQVEVAAQEQQEQQEQRQQARKQHLQQQLQQLQQIQPVRPPQSVVHPAAVDPVQDEKVPPLPPKRTRKQDSNAENRSIEANNAGDSNSNSNSNNNNTDIPPVESLKNRKPRLPPPIIHYLKDDQLPPNKRLPPKPDNNPNFNTLPKQKKPGFFSKIFSRRKSKPELSQSNENCSSSSKRLSPNASREPSIGHFNMNDPMRASQRSAKSLQTSKSANSSPVKGSKKALKGGKPCGRSVSSVSGKRPANLTADVVHIPLKGESDNSLPRQPQHEGYSSASTITLGKALDRRTASALQLADIPILEGGMELVAIADRQSLRNLVSSIEGQFNVQLDPNMDLTEVEHFALYTSIPPQATASEFDETSAYYASVDAGEILTPDEVARRLAAASAMK